ncbi:hypothetical protein PIB30_035984 [Stylosanthes scabra]|uniref:Transposase (putative) gypsy type domain-containing protein n=1 Tax=Stylosanthes scabra TaxID=79078 RepID=A0ABU6TE11_9FABA|nr:hypothetical protein [Stylosanthes scabra]
MVGGSEVSTGGVYGWVKEGVLEIPSLFVDVESVEQLGSPLLWVRSGQDIKIEFLPCSSVDRVCHEGKGADWFFMYTCVFAEIGVRFPFTEFECAVLRQLNCAPSQIHPNSWAFIRAFEVLMEYLQEEPSLGLFFFLFQAKGVDSGVWETLSSDQGRTVFSLFKATYRDFKKFYVKESGSVFGVEELSERDACLCEFLFENLKGGKILTTSELLKWDSNSGAVIKYLETKVPDCSTAGLKSFFKQRAKREVSTSHVVKVEQGSEVNKPSERRRPVSLKRMRTQDVFGKKVIDLTEGRCCSRDVDLEKVVEFSRSQQGLHGFDESDSLSSLWSERYPFSVVADEHFQAKADVDMLKRTGKVAAARYVQLQALEEESSQKSKRADVLELEKKLRFATEQVGLKEKENGLLKEENDGLKVTISNLSKDKKDLEGRVVEVCGERKEAEVSKRAHEFEMFAAAWDRAKAQIELLLPGADLEKMDPVKVVYKGELVDDDQVPAEGRDDHNPAE